MSSLAPAPKEQGTAGSRGSFYEKAVGMLLAAGAAAPAADAAIVHWEGAGVIDTGNLAPSGAVVSLQIGTGFGSTAYGFVKGIGALSLPTDSLAGFFREAGAPAVGNGNAFGPAGAELYFAQGTGGAEFALANATFSDDNLFAFSFTSGAVNGGAPVYGWARLDIPAGNAVSGTRITEWAYDDGGAPITLGDTGAAIPEPSSLALLAAGAAGGVACFHRQRRRRETAEAAA